MVIFSDVTKVGAGIGDKNAVFLQWVTCSISATVIAFVHGWQVALLCSIFTPFLALIGVFYSTVGNSYFVDLSSFVLFIHELFFQKFIC